MAIDLVTVSVPGPQGPPAVSGVSAGTYTNTTITVNSSGVITAISTGSSSGGVSSFNTRTGAVTLTSSDVTTALGFTPGTGTVSSVGLTTSGTYAGALTVSGSPVTGSGSITVTPNVFGTSTPGVVPGSGGGTTNFLRADGTWTTPAGGGSVTSVSVTTANGVSGSVANSTTTPAITLTLGAITPSSIAVGSGGALNFSNATGITAAGTTQGTATALTCDTNFVTTVSSGTGVVLPTATAGREVTVVNRGANALLVYPASGASIDGAAANAATSVPVNGWLTVSAASSTQWYAIDPVTVGGTGISITQSNNGTLTVGLTSATTTIGTTGITLGSSSTTLAGLTSVTSTSFTGALTGNASTATSLAGGAANGIPYQTGTGATAFLAQGTGVLQESAGAPAWTTTPTLTGTNFSGTAASLNIGGNAATATSLAGGAANGIPYQTGSGATTFLAQGTGVLQESAGAPAWTTAPAIAGTNFTTSTAANLSIGGNAATATTATSATSATTATNLASGAAGSLPYQSAAATTAMLAVGSTGNILTVVSGLPAWSTYVISGTASQTYTMPAATTTIAGTTSTQTLTNKRNTKRVLALSANSATPAINTDNYDVVHITAQTAGITSFTTNLTGTPVDGDTLRISVTGTASVSLSFGSSFESSGTQTLPSTTSGTTRLDMGFFWNTETSKWRFVGAA